MESSQKTRIEIIDWIAGLYNLGNRSISETGACLYNGPDGKRCAMAMMCTHPERLLECLTPGGFGAGAIAVQHQEWIRPEFRGHPVAFYDDIQSLHDEGRNWSETGLSEFGQKRVDELKLDWA